MTIGMTPATAKTSSSSAHVGSSPIVLPPCVIHPMTLTASDQFRCFSPSQGRLALVRPGGLQPLNRGCRPSRTPASLTLPGAVARRAACRALRPCSIGAVRTGFAGSHTQRYDHVGSRLVPVEAYLGG